MSHSPPAGRAGDSAAAGQSWSPLLTGPAADGARRTLDDLAVALRHPPEGWTPTPTLSGGSSGLALFHAYLALARDSDEAAEQAVAWLGEAADGVGSGPLAVNLYGGFAGIAWTMEHLRGRLLDPDEEDPAAAADEMLDDLAARDPEGLALNGEFDLLFGLVSLGVYALERLPRPWAKRYLALLIDRLEAACEHRPGGFAWRNDPSRLPPRIRRWQPENGTNLGVAHGMPGVIAWLARVVAAGVEVPRARALLDGAVAWLLAQRLPGGGFPAWQVVGKTPEPARSAWCYGDPGVAVALLGAARAVGEAEWESGAVELALAAAARPEGECRVRDACLCHGAAGLGHVFNRLWQATGEAELGAAARRWFERALAYREPGRGVAGFLAWGEVRGSELPEDEEGEEGWVASRGFLDGAAGIGLALLAATTPLEPAWDRLLLADVPPGA